MRRRKLLTTMGVGTAALASGCLGYTIESEDDVNDRKDRVDTLQDERDSLEDDYESLEESNSNLEEEISNVESDLDGSKSKQILYLYSWGLTHQNNATDAYNEANSYFQNGDYTGARAEYNLSGGYYHSAENNFRGAKNLADGLDESTVENYCSQAESRCGSMSDATGSYQSSMYYYMYGDTYTAQDYLNSADSYYTDAQDYTLHDLGDLESQLGVSIDV